MAAKAAKQAKQDQLDLQALLKANTLRQSKIVAQVAADKKQFDADQAARLALAKLNDAQVKKDQAAATKRVVA